MAAIRSSTEITQIINRSQHAVADLGTQLVDEEKRGIISTNVNHRNKMNRLILLRAMLHNILDDDANVRAYYTVNLTKFNLILDGLVALSQSFNGPGINIIGVRRNLLFYTSTSSGSTTPTVPGGVTAFENLDVDSAGAVVDSFSASSAREFAIYYYKARGSNGGEGTRAGMIIATWRGTDVDWTEIPRTPDVVGITSPITFTFAITAGNAELTAVAATDNWIIQGTRIT